MKSWMGMPEMKLEIKFGTGTGERVAVSGHHHGYFVNKGAITLFEPYQRLQYTHWSSVSRLEDEARNYTVFTFLLEAVAGQTRLTFEASRFPTEAIYHHLNFYWRGAVHLIKQVVENQAG
jgi:uncharacterized protein YndB with AHSA1/START domain